LTGPQILGTREKERRCRSNRRSLPEALARWAPSISKGLSEDAAAGAWAQPRTLFDADRVGLLLLDQAGALRWASGSDRLVEAGVSHLSAPVQLGGGQVGTLDLCDPRPREWDDGDAAALPAYAGLVASVLAAAVAAGSPAG
jgi:GAF domain-containing protein